MHTWENQAQGVPTSPEILGNCKLLNLGHNHVDTDVQISRLLYIYMRLAPQAIYLKCTLHAL